MKKQQGFTLVELVVALVILGIMAAVALPKFVDLGKDARIAKLNTARGAVITAAELISNTVQLRGGVADAQVCPGTTVTANNTTTVCTKGGIVNIVNRNPQALLPPGAGGVVSAAGLGSIFAPTLAQFNAGGYNATGGGNAIASTLTVQVTGGTNAANCSFQYTPSTGTGAGQAGSTANVTAAIITGC